MDSLTIALWQCEQRPGDVAGNLARIREAALQAAAEGASLLVCPEMVLTGYAIDRATVQRLAEAADGPSSRAIAAIAREAGLAIVWGFAERAADGAVFNAARAVGPSGEPLGTYRKTHLFGDLDRARFSASDGAPVVFDLAGWRVGLLICYDVEFPEAVRALAIAGADLVAVPTANMAGFEVVTDVLLPARAYENQLFVAYANCCGDEGALRYGGSSAVAGPEGRLVARAGTTAALTIVALPTNALREAALPYLADRRPEAYGALVEPFEPRSRESGLP